MVSFKKTDIRIPIPLYISSYLSRRHSVSTRTADPEMNAPLTGPKKTKTHAPFSRTPNSTAKANGDIGYRDFDEDESAPNLKEKPRGKSASAATKSGINVEKGKPLRLLTSPKSRLKKQMKSDLSKKKNKLSMTTPTEARRKRRRRPRSVSRRRRKVWNLKESSVAPSGRKRRIGRRRSERV